MTNEKIFKEYALDLFYNLSYDKIINVRYTLASFISIIWNKNKKEYEWIKSNEKMIEIIYKLKNDNGNEVKKCFDNIEINMDLIKEKGKILEEKNVNFKFINEFNDFKKLFDYVPILGKSWLKK